MTKKNTEDTSESATQAEAQANAQIDPQIDPRLLEILICPVTGGRLQYDREANELISKKAKLAFSIRAGVPIMLADEARVLD